MKKYGKVLVFMAFILALVAIFVFLYMQTKPEEILYEKVSPVVKDIDKMTVVTGKIVPRDEINVKPQISGIITEVFKEPGESVKEGEVIAKVKVIPEMSSLSSAQSRVRLSEINLNQAQINLDREQELFDKLLISREEYEKVLQARDQAKAEYETSRHALAWQLVSGSSKYRMKSLHL